MKNGWPITRLGDLSDLVTKGTTPTSIGHEFVKDGINFVKVESISPTGEFIQDKLARITPGCHAALGRSQLQAGDILFSIAGALGRTAFVTDDILPANTNQALAIIRLRRDAGVSAKFVLKALETGAVLGQVEKFRGGVAQQNLSLAQVRDFQIALPPLPEQQRIVGILDEAFEGIATAKANAEKNLQNARALFESHLQSVFAHPGKGWDKKLLAELCESSRVITYGVIKLGDEVPNGVPCLRTSNVRWLRIETEGMKRIAPALSLEYSRTILKGGEVLVNVRGTLGGVAIAGPEMAGWNVSREVAVVPIDSTQINPEFVSYLIGSGTSQQWLGGVKKGAAYVGVNIEDLRLLPVSAPNMNEQKELLRHLQEIREETQRLESIYQQKLAALEALKKSLLHQAFTGQL